MDKFQIFFSKLFSSIILDNEIVSTILYKISLQFSEMKTKIDNTLNNDI